MKFSKMKRQAWGRAFASFLLLATLAPAVATGPALAEGRNDDFFALFKKKNGSKKQPANVSTNANTGHDATVGGGKATTETAVVVEQNVAPMLSATGAAELREASARYRDILAQGGFPKVARGNLKKGAKGKNVIALNRRLFVEGYVRAEATEGEFASIYTTATEDGVRRFQQNMGLAATGRFDAVTADLMNIPVQQRIKAIEANIARLEAYAENLGDRYLIVNIPAQQIETVSGGRVFSKHNAIVGRPERPSPVVMTALSDVNFNPYWNAPVSIVEKDLIPKMRGGNDILREMNIRVFKGFGGPEIDPDSVNWRTAIPDDYHFRQEPGEHNAMATAKINFPSPFGVYMHDTPEKQLFNSNNRFFSSGCVRVQNMPLLVNWVLNGQDGIGEAEIATLGETLERRDVKLATPPQVRFAYLTAWPTTGGTVAFRKDIYELDGTGFVTGQPMPVGELSPDGQRYVLKPLPRLVASVEDENSSGGFFGFSRKKTPNSGVKRASFFSTENAGATSGDDEESASGKIIKKPNSLTKKPATAANPADKKAKSKTAKGKKDAPGLFDWAAWRKEQAAAAKGGKGKKVVKKDKASDKSKTAAKKDKDAGAKKVASADKADPKTDVKAKDAAAKKKPVDAKAADAKKAADSKTAATDKKAPDAAAKKPVAKKADCKPGADGKLPDGCKAADAGAKKKPVPATTAAN
jgi:peptidoglycan hydrolase-like protein with peptidoglycan-binding domain